MLPASSPETLSRDCRAPDQKRDGADSGFGLKPRLNTRLVQLPPDRLPYRGYSSEALG